ncbi:MAG: gamma-glutamylcyclotransferase family protein [Thiolinea sp.]
MLRIVFWKLGFEWANLKRILQPRDDQTIYYFAFGANLSPDILKQRRIAVLESFDYILEGAELRFSQPGFYKGHAYASADEAPGKKMYGRMLLIRKSDAERMDYYEGVPFLKAHDKVVHQSPELTFYYYRARTTAEGLKPTQEYLDFITTAYRQMDCVPTEYLEQMETTEVLEHFEMQTLTGRFIRDIDSWPSVLHPVLIKYEGIGRWLVKLMWNWSVLTWMIKD